MSERGSNNDSVATAIEHFITELQRRKVVRVAIVYGAFAWLVLQFSDIIIDAFAAPDWVMRVLLLFLVLALPATLILAWLFDITPTGIRLTSDSLLDNQGLQPSILLISRGPGYDSEDAESLCSQLSHKLSPMIKRYGGHISGMHEGHCVVQFQDSGTAVSCGLAVLQMFCNSLREISISIATGHYDSAGISPQAINIAESINSPLEEHNQQLIISTAIYERELSTNPNPLLKYLDSDSRLVHGHKLIAYRVNPDALKNSAIQWRLKDHWEAAANRSTLFGRHKILLASVLALGVAFSWLYLSYEQTGTTLVRSIAIMPFRNLDESTASKAISLGLHEDLQNRIRQLEGVKITSSRSSRALATQDLAVPELGKKLNVNYLVEGSIRQEDQLYLVTINLAETASGQVIWSDRYQTSQNDLYSVQEDVIKQLSAMLDISTAPSLDTVQLSNEDYGLYLEAIGSFELPNVITHLQKIETTLQDLLSRYPDYAPAEAGLCRVHLTRFGSSKSISDYQKAESYCESAEQSIGDNINILHSLAQMNIVRGNWEKAQTYVDKGLVIETNNLDLLLDSALISSQVGELEMAEEILLQAIRVDSEYWKSHDRLGLIYYTTNRLDDSILAFNRASDLMPNDVEILNHLGAAYFNQGDFTRASKAFVQSLGLNPNPNAYSNAGTVYYFAGDYRKARELHLKATQLEPTNYLFWRNLADSESAIPGQYSSAMSHYRLVSTSAEEWVQITPNDTQALSNLAWALAQTEQSNAAIKYIQLALSLAPEDANVLYDASITYTRLGNEAKALEYIKRAIDAGYPVAVIAATPGLNAFYPGIGPISKKESS